MKLLMLGLIPGIKKLNSYYDEIRRLNGSDLRNTIEREWKSAIVFRDSYYGFLIMPCISIVDLVRYQQLSATDETTKRQIIDYLVHLSQERPFVLEALTPLFKQKAFRNRIQEAYSPLMQTTVQRILKATKASADWKTIGYEDSIISHVNDAFDRLLVKFDYYYKTRPKT